MALDHRPVPVIGSRRRVRLSRSSTGPNPDCTKVRPDIASDHYDHNEAKSTPSEHEGLETRSVPANARRIGHIACWTPRTKTRKPAPPGRIKFHKGGSASTATATMAMSAARPVMDRQAREGESREERETHAPRDRTDPARMSLGCCVGSGVAPYRGCEDGAKVPSNRIEARFSATLLSAGKVRPTERPPPEDVRLGRERTGEEEREGQEYG